MNQLLHNRVGKQSKPKSQKKGCLFLMLGSCGTVAATALFIWVVSFITGEVVEARHGADAAYVLLTSQMGCIAAALSLFTGIMGLWYFAPSGGEPPKENRGLAPMLGQKETQTMSGKTKWLVTAGLLAGVVLTGAVAVNSYRLVTPHGISTYFFVETKSYEWKQVSAYTIDCDSDDGLSVTFTMRDGKKFEILQGINSTTAKFDEEYSSVTHFAADLDQNMVDLQVPRNVKHMERAVNFYKSYPHLWPHVSKLIGYVELVPEPDETSEDTTAPDTAPDTEPGTDASASE